MAVGKGSSKRAYPMKGKAMPAGMPKKMPPGKPMMTGKEMGLAMRGKGRMGKGKG